MANIVWDICQSGSFNWNTRGAFVDSGAHLSSTSASNLTDGAAGAGSAVEAVVGHILTIKSDADGRVRFGGVDAQTNVGVLITADVTEYIEISHPGTISVIDLA